MRISGDAPLFRHRTPIVKIKHKLPLAFAAVLALLLLAALFGIQALRHSLDTFSVDVQRSVSQERQVRSTEAAF